MVPKDQVSDDQVESYVAQERGKRRELLHNFIQSCSASKVQLINGISTSKFITFVQFQPRDKSNEHIKQVQVDTILIESDFIAKAIIDLIPILQIQNLVIGANNSQLRYTLLT